METENLLRELNLPDIGDTDKYGNTALHLVVKNKTFTQNTIVAVLEILIDKGVNPDSKNNKNQTVLHLAIANRLKDVVNCLLAHKVNLDLVAHYFVENEYSAFQELLACLEPEGEWHEGILRLETESVDFVEWLISKGVDFDYKDQENKSALNIVIERNLQHILPVLLKYTKNINFIDKENKTLLHLFLEKNFTSVYHSVNSITRRWYGKRYATKIVRILLDGGVSALAEDIHKLTPIQIAIVKEEDIGVIQMLIEQCPNSYQRDIYEATKFQVVIRYCSSARKSRRDCYLKIRCSSIAKGTNVNKLYELDYGYTALSYAVEHRNMQLLQFLGENGADFTVTTKDGRNLLHMLAIRTVQRRHTQTEWFEGEVPPYEFVFLHDLAIDHIQHIAVVQMLVEHGVEVGHIKTRDNTAALRVAAVRGGDLGLMISLEKNGINFNVSRKCEVVIPKLDNNEQQENMDVVELSEKNQESIYVVELSEENGEDFRSIIRTHENLLHRKIYSSENNYTKTDDDTNIKLFDLLISRGCQVNAKDMIGNTPLHEAVSHDNETIVRKLIEHGADVNCKRNDGMTPLHIAAFGRVNMGLLKLLLKNGADVNAATKDGETLLHLMLKYSKDLKYDEDYEAKPREPFHWLMSEGCQVNVKDNSGTSPLHLAAEHASDEVVKMLIEHGANVNTRNSGRETPLHFAVKNRDRRAEVSKLLLTHGANVNATDLKGRTVLHKIATEFESGFLEMLRTLLKYGADVTVLNKNGLSAASCAQFREHRLSLDEKYQHYFWSMCRMDVCGDEHEYFVLEFSEDEGWHFVQKSSGEYYISEDDYDEEKFVQGYPRDNGNYNVKLSFVRHSLKLKAANLPWDPIIDNGLDGLEMSSENKGFCKNYYEDCLKDVVTLKNIFIDDDRTSIYALLHMNLNRRTAHVHNKKLLELTHLTYPRFTIPFIAKYFALILACYREAVTRKALMEPATEAWLEVTKIYLPVELVEFIFSFLSNADLFNMIEKD